MIEILVKRIAKKPNYTIGKLFINGVFFANTLEDTDRGLTQSMSEDEIKKKKIYGQTAIPTGTYKVDMNTVSPKFKNRSWAKPYDGKLPRLVNVPGFDGVLTHPGNLPQDTLGCLLVGKNDVVHIQKEYGIKDASKIAIKNIKTIKEDTTSTGINF